MLQWIVTLLSLSLVSGCSKTEQSHTTYFGKAKYNLWQTCPIFSPHGGCEWHGTLKVGSKRWDSIHDPVPNADNSMVYFHANSSENIQFVVDTNNGEVLASVDKQEEVHPKFWCNDPKIFYFGTSYEPFPQGDRKITLGESGEYRLNALRFKDGKSERIPIFSAELNPKGWRQVQRAECGPYGGIAFIVQSLPEKLGRKYKTFAEMKKLDPNWRNEWQKNFTLSTLTELYIWTEAKGTQRMPMGEVKGDVDFNRGKFVWNGPDQASFVSPGI